MKSVVVLGKGDLAIRACEWFLNSKEYNLTHVVPVIPEPKWASSISSWATKNNVKVVKTGHYKDLNIEPDLAMSVFYDKIIKKNFIDSCKKIINLHNSPLPKYRGVSPINWALKNNETEHGITIHEITPGIDDGPIISQLKYSIYPDIDEVLDVYKRSQEYGYSLFKNTMPMIDSITPRKQNESKAFYYDASKNILLGERRFFTKEETGARNS